MPLISPLNTALSALKAHERAFEAHAQNVANVNTEDYRAVEATFQASPDGGVNVRFERGPEPPEGQSGVDLNDEAVNSIVLKAGYKANAAMARNADDLVGSLLDLIG